MLQIQDWLSQSRPLALECICDCLRDVTGLDCGDRSWICNVPQVCDDRFSYPSGYISMTAAGQFEFTSLSGLCGLKFWPDLRPISFEGLRLSKQWLGDLMGWREFMLPELVQLAEDCSRSRRFVHAVKTNILIE